ncbi:GNAT family N-acetyltransferase [Alphaproteobacteria bacterium]|jgi:ribosomal protein S18 acetylase RimI-like enzyme|nr:GNAT family N-acetyltransferase [Alphaproteobacteria bacterium]
MPQSHAIRNARPEDADRIQQIAHNAYAHYRSRMDRDPAPMLADFNNHIKIDTVFVISFEGEGDNAINGYAILIENDDGWLLDNLAIDPNAQKSGMGKALVEHCEGFLKYLNVAKYRLYTNVVMHESLAWWLSLGFEETDRRLESGFNRVYMEKHLSR